MPGVIEAVYADRAELASVLKKHRGIRKIVEDLYPDNAHFIYELLQNAEDTHATQVNFELKRDALLFRHNGHPFYEDNVYAITDIGEGTKAEDSEKIGKFGIGFKAVFAYTETPRIWSPTFSFQISELVLPTSIPERKDIEQNTLFQFPFNNPKKPAWDAVAEITSGLENLAKTTLLFLTHIESLRWTLPDGRHGKLLRVQHPAHHVEILEQQAGKTTSIAHYLRFSAPVIGLEKQTLAIAFELQPLPKAASYVPGKAISEQLRIVPAEQGQVSVFFPAEKETSGLRFHINAPFIPELSRASVKDTAANEPLFDQLADLLKRSLHSVREMRLFGVDFLEVLPNSNDRIPIRYDRFRKSVKSSLVDEALTPTYDKKHAPAKYLVQARAALKALLTPQDLAFLTRNAQAPLGWAVAASQKNSNADRLLNDLGMREWNIKVLLDRFEEGFSQSRQYMPHHGKYLIGPVDEYKSWLSGKSFEWHQFLYATIYEDPIFQSYKGMLRMLQIVRLATGEYASGGVCFFPSEGKEGDKEMPRVDRRVYTSGKATSEKESARNFLMSVGVREVGEAEEIEALLKTRYTIEKVSPRSADIERFIKLVEQDPVKAQMFRNFPIFEDETGNWRKPSNVYLDTPFIPTGMRAYYKAIKGEVHRTSLSDSYCSARYKTERFVAFAKAVGVAHQLEVVKAPIWNNPKFEYLHSVGGERETSPIRQDWTIEHIATILENPSVELARLLWQTMCSLPRRPDYLVATFQRNGTWGAHEAESQLVHHLRDTRWIPQGDCMFVAPSEANRSRLPDGFPFDSGSTWLRAVKFGESVVKRTEEHRKQRELAKSLGFEDDVALEHARRFAQLSPDEREQFLRAHEAREQLELPESEPSDTERRKERVRAKAQGVPDRQSESRSRSVSIGADLVKGEAKAYLRRQYTRDGVMYCQACKGAMPFKLSDGAHYFEAVEFLSQMRGRHSQNYLALCPNHAAMFLYASNPPEHEDVSTCDGDLSVVLAAQKTSLFFTKTHLLDIKVVLEGDGEASHA